MPTFAPTAGNAVTGEVAQQYFLFLSTKIAVSMNQLMRIARRCEHERDRHEHVKRQLDVESAPNRRGRGVSYFLSRNVEPPRHTRHE